MTTPDEPDAPPGAQPERTALAWQRMTLGVALGAVLLTLAAVRAQTEYVAVASGMLSAWIAWSLLGPTSAISVRVGRDYSAWRSLTRVAVTVAVLGLLGAALAGGRAMAAAA